MTACWVIRLTVVLHMGWAIMLAFSGDGLHTTPVHALYAATGSVQWLLVAVLLVCSALAFYGELQPPSMRSALLLIPQQVLVVIVAAGAVWAVSHGEYADGVQRDGTGFILPDQWAYICIAYFYTREVLVRHGVRLWEL